MIYTILKRGDNCYTGFYTSEGEFYKFKFQKHLYKFRQSSVPYLKKFSKKRFYSRKIIGYKRLIYLIIPDKRFLSYDESCYEYVSFYKRKFKKALWEIDYRTCDQDSCHRKHISWKKQKKQKQWM